MSAFYSPLRYPGGKNCIFPFMAQLIQENGLVGCSYAEPYAGGAGLALHLLLKGIVSEIFLNDLDRSIYTFWGILLTRTEEFCNWINSVDVSMDTWRWAKNIHSHMDDFNDMDLAKATFFLNRTNVSGIIMGGPIGGSNQTGKFPINARFNKQDLITRIHDIVQYRDSIHLSNLDGIDFLNVISRMKRQMFIYIDPPYVNKGQDLYMNAFDEVKHSILCARIRKLRKLWLVSYDNAPLVNQLYSKFNRVSYSISQCTSNRMGDEIIIYPSRLKTDLALGKLKSPLLLH